MWRRPYNDNKVGCGGATCCANKPHNPRRRVGTAPSAAYLLPCLPPCNTPCRVPRLKSGKGMFYALNSTDTLRSKHVFIFDSNANATAAMRSLYWRTCVPSLLYCAMGTLAR